MVAPSPDDGAATFRLFDHVIHVAPGLFASVGDLAARAAPAHRYVLIADETVARLHGAAVRASFHDAAPLELTVPSGEQHKTRARWAELTDRMLDARCGRDTTVVALGGGVVGDLAGFVAATFMRGIPFVQVPTTLLAMIDASIGGKTGVDTPAGKNLVGAFHQPSAVLTDVRALRTLPRDQLRSGAAEAIKHGVIADAAYFHRLDATLPAVLRGDDEQATHALIVDSIAIKVRIVAADEQEGGLRKILNFGHTLGHAIEAASGYRLLHGECVAIGMVLESRLAERLGIAVPGLSDRIQAVVKRAGLPTEIPPGLSPEHLLALTRTDKKARAGVAEYALPTDLGAMAAWDSGWSVAVGDRDVLGLLRDAQPASTPAR